MTHQDTAHGYSEHSHDERRRSTRRPEPSLFTSSSTFVDLVWNCDEGGMCMSFGCGECGALAFRRRIAEFAPPEKMPTALAEALAVVDFTMLRLAPHWYDALDIALFELRSLPSGCEHLAHVVGAWLERDDIPLRVLDLVMFRHARYEHPTEAMAELWTQRCLDAAAGTEDEGLVETLILACPERVGSHPAAHRAALETARRSPYVRRLISRLPHVA